MEVRIKRINNGWLIKIRHITHFYSTVQEAAAAADAIKDMDDLPEALTFQIKEMRRLMDESAAVLEKKFTEAADPIGG